MFGSHGSGRVSYVQHIHTADGEPVNGVIEVWWTDAAPTVEVVESSPPKGYRTTYTAIDEDLPDKVVDTMRAIKVYNRKLGRNFLVCRREYLDSVQQAVARYRQTTPKPGKNQSSRGQKTSKGGRNGR